MEEINIYKLQVMKALGWYIHMHKEIKQKQIAMEMHIDPAAISRSIISPKDADFFDENKYLNDKKRLIDISKANEICKHMHTTLPNVLFYYQFKDQLVNLTKLDNLEKLTIKLTEETFCHELLTQNVDNCILDINNDKKDEVNTEKDINNLISNVEHPDFRSWFGKYYCYFSSTSSEEVNSKRRKEFDRFSDDPEIRELLINTPMDYIFCGILNVYNDSKYKDGLCHVDLKFLSNPEKRSIKRYSGILTLSAITKAGFCELYSNEQGEKSYFIFEKQDLGKEQPHIRCCMAMVLTYSSKVHRRRPCCERMIISSDIFQEGTEEYKTMKAYLRMNDNYIRITQWGYDELIKDILQSTDPELREIAEKFPTLQSLEGKNVSVENCAFIPESIINTMNTLTASQKQKFEVLLRMHSLAPWYCKTKANKADVLFKLINNHSHG